MYNNGFVNLKRGLWTLYSRLVYHRRSISIETCVCEQGPYRKYRVSIMNQTDIIWYESKLVIVLSSCFQHLLKVLLDRNNNWTKNKEISHSIGIYHITMQPTSRKVINVLVTCSANFDSPKNYFSSHKQYFANQKPQQILYPFSVCSFRLFCILSSNS